MKHIPFLGKEILFNCYYNFKYDVVNKDHKVEAR